VRAVEGAAAVEAVELQVQAVRAAAVEALQLPPANRSSVFAK
jgi:hypothetical protein